MKPEKQQDLLRQGKRLLVHNQPKDALGKFRECITEDPEHHEAYYLMAQACLKMEMPDEALTFFLEAIKFDPDNITYCENLGEIYANRGEYWNAYRYFSGAGVDSIDSVEALNAYAECAGGTGHTSTQIHAFEKSLRIKPDQATIKDRLSELTTAENPSPAGQRKKIAVFATNDYFLSDIVTHFEKGYDVRKFNGSSLSDLASLMRWSDLSWFEWCDNLVVHASKLPKYTTVVCRMHRYEVFTDMPQKVNWKNIDHLVCVFDIIRDVAQEKLNLNMPISIIQNGVDFSRYSISAEKKYGKKVAYVGYIKMSKGPELLLQCFKKIHDYDPGYSFHIAGRHVDREVEIYCDHMIKEMDLPVTFCGWVSDIPEWLKDKDYIICSSISESFMYALVEGIACGLMPLVHNWPGSDLIYPKESLFLTADDCLNLLKHYEKIDKLKKAVTFRDSMQERFSLEKQLGEIDALIEHYL